MQGIESLDNFKSFVSSIGGLGRYEDTYIVHAAEGETVVPMEVFDKNPVLKERLFESMRDMGIEPERYIVGNQLNSINPVTGQPEFFLKKIFRRLRKAKQDVGRRLRKAAADASGYVAPIVGAIYGPAAGAAAGAFLGQYKRENPGDPNQALQMALRGGISGLGTNIATGQGALGGTGLSAQYGLNPLNIGRGVLGMGEMGFTPGSADVMQQQMPKVGFIDKGGINLLEGLQNTFMNQGDGSFFERFKFNDILGAGGDPNLPVGDPKNQSVLEKLFGKNKLLQLLFKFGASKVLGDVIKEENEEAQKNMENQMANYGKQTNFDFYNSLINPGELVQAPDTALTDVFATAADGGILDLDAGGELKGPGTGTSDSIPAMLSDGEFVMTAKAVRGAGGGDRREGARKMYETMDKLEAQA